MATTKKAALPAAKERELKNLKEFRKLASKELSALRRGLADALGTAEAAKAGLEQAKSDAKEAKELAKRLVRDPIYSVPVDLKRRVEALEADFKKLKVQVSTRATAEQLDKAQEALQQLRGNLDEVAETQGDHVDRLAALEEAITKPDGAEHADPPAHPSPSDPSKADPRQTTIDDAIAKAKGRDPSAEEEQAMDNAVVPPPEGEEARP